MKGSVKLFIASIVVLACALGFFAGSLCFGGPKGHYNKGMMPPPPPPGFEMGKPGPDQDMDHSIYNRRGPKVAPEYLGSILQVTPEQKAKLSQQRSVTDSTVKAIRQQRRDAEKQLREALDSGDAAKIQAAKANILAAQEAMLDQRIKGFSSLSEILSKEQIEKFQAFHKEQMKKAHGNHKGPKGPKPPQHE